MRPALQGKDIESIKELNTTLESYAREVHYLDVLAELAFVLNLAFLMGAIWLDLGGKRRFVIATNDKKE